MAETQEEPLVNENVEVIADAYVISITTHVSELVDGKLALVERTQYFKADRYSVYNGRLQTVLGAKEAMHFKTAKGAANAIARLSEKGTIKRKYKIRVVKYTYTVTRTERYEIVTGEIV